MRVRCVRIVRTSAPALPQREQERPQIRLGAEYPVLSLLVESDAAALLPRLIQVLTSNGPSWWPMEMFVSVSSTVPSNWTAELRADGSLHLAPEPWLRPGFWEEYFDSPSAGAAAQAFRREAELIVREG